MPPAAFNRIGRRESYVAALGLGVIFVVVLSLKLRASQRRATNTGGEIRSNTDSDDSITDRNIPDDKSEENESKVELERKNMFFSLSNDATRLFKSSNYEEAAQRYSEALDMCDLIPGFDVRRAILLNNRSAMYEKAHRYDACLDDCDRCLALNPTHPLARVRKARVLERQLKYEEALTELCAHVTVQLMSYQASIAQGQQANEPEQPPRMEDVLKKVSECMADQYSAMWSSEVQKPLPVKSVTEKVLGMFESHAVLVEQYKNVNDKSFDEDVEVADSAESRGAALSERGLLRVARKEYELAAEDFANAYELVKESEEDMSQAVISKILFWHATFLHLRSDFDNAVAVLEKAVEYDPLNPDIYVKLASIAIDRNNLTQGKSLLAKAMDANVKSATVYFIRSMLYSLEGNTELSRSDLQTCLDLSPNYLAALIRLITDTIQEVDIQHAGSAIDEALKKYPNVCDLMLLKAEFVLSTAMYGEKPELLEEAFDWFEKAIQADPENPNAYSGKGVALLQSVGDFDEGTKMFERALELDPDFPGALINLGQVRIQRASSEEEGMEAIKLFERAINGTRDRESLLHLCSIRAAGLAKIKASKILGNSP